ncbi:MAG: sporulation protein YqfD [Bacillota bacterium]
MRGRVWRYIDGSVSLLLEGGSPERFLNLAMSQGIYPWDMRYVEGALILSVPARCFGQLRGIAKTSGCRIRITGKYGLPFVLVKARRRRMLLVGGILCAGAIYIMASMVWFIEVTGLERIPPEAVLKAARGQGLAPGTLRSRLDVDATRNAILLETPGLSWVGIHQKGTLVVIEVVEKTLHPDPSQEEQPGPIVARDDSYVVDVLALRGRAVVEPGTLVRKGDVLIEPDPETGMSRGIAKGKFWYQGYGECGFSRTWTERTGRSSRGYVLKWNGREILNTRRPAFARFEEEATVWALPSWRNLNLPVELHSVEYYEIRVIQETLSREMARRVALNNALKAAREVLPPGAERSVIWGEVAGEGPEHIAARVTMETLEDIAARPGGIQ